MGQYRTNEAYVRQPCSDTDFLDQSQLAYYLSLTSRRDQEVLASSEFETNAQEIYASTGTEQFDAKTLADLVPRSLARLKHFQDALQNELVRPGVAEHFVEASKRLLDTASAMTASTFPAFVRFCVAYRIHCYFEPPLEVGSGQGVLPAGEKAEVVFAVGPTEAGLSELCARIAGTFSFRHLRLRELLEFQSPTSSNGFVLDAVSVARMICKAVCGGGGAPQAARYLIEGFPRTLDELQCFKEMTAESPLQIRCCLSLTCSREALEEEHCVGVNYTTDEEVIEAFRCEGLLQEVRDETEVGVEEAWHKAQAIFGPRVVFVVGGPGAGRETQCSRICNAFGYKHLRVSSLLRAESHRPEVQAAFQEKRLVDSNLTAEIILQTMRKGGWAGTSYLIDGFPKCMADLRSWEAAVKDTVLVKFCLFLECSEGVMERRLEAELKRVSKEAMQNMFFTFYQGTMPVVDHFHEGGLLRKVNADISIEEVWSHVRPLFGPTVVFVFGGPKSGKGLQSKRLAETFGYRYVSVGDLIQEAGKKGAGSPRPILLNRVMSEDDGEYLPGNVVVDLIQEALKGLDWEGGKYVIGGFPQTLEQLAMWKQCFGSRATVKLAILLQCPESFLMARLQSQTGFVEPAALLRLRLASTEIPRITEHLQEMGILRRVSGNTLNSLQVWQDVRQAMGPSVVFVLGELGTEQQMCDRMAEEFKLQHINIRHLHLFGDAASPVEPDALVQCLHAAMEDRGWVGAKYIVSGFPRSMDDMRAWELRFGNSAATKLAISSEVAWDLEDITEEFEDRGILRWIDATQSTEEVWSTVREVMHMELDAHVMNRAMLLIAPSAQTTQLERYIRAHLTTHGIAVLDTGEVATDVLVRANLFEGETAIKTAVEWMEVEFSPGQLTWAQFNKEVIGEGPIETAEAGSLLGTVFRHWTNLGLPVMPEGSSVIRASGGPLEGLQANLLCKRMKPIEHPVARSLFARGVPRHTLDDWLENPDVEGWMNSPDDVARSGRIFHCTRGCDFEDFREAAFAFTTLQRQSGPRRVSVRWHARARRPLRSKSRSSTIMFSRTPTLVAGTLANGSFNEEDDEEESDEEENEIDEDFEAKIITLIHFNDVYNVEPRKKEPVGGIARFVWKVQELKAQCMCKGEPPLCLFSGDAFNPSLTSTFTRGKHMVPALNAVGIDCACFGNHDFDFGSEALEELRRDTNFPWLASNVLEKATGEPLGGGLVSSIIELHGWTIGIIGLIEKEWLVTLHAFEPEDVEYEDFCRCAKRLASQLREDGADLIIALTHMRMPNDYLLAQEVPEVDIILGGHDHHYESGQHGPQQTYVLNSGTDFRDLSLVRVQLPEQKGGRPTVLETQHVEILSSIPEDESMRVLVEDCQKTVGAEMDKVIGQSAVDLDCRFCSIRTEETNIGNFVADVMRDSLKADIAILNSGSLRADAVIEKGDFHMRDLLSILPMLDELCLLELSGSQLLRVLENSVSQYPRLEGRFLQVSGIRFTFDASKPGGQRLVEGSIFIGDELFLLSNVYKVCTLDFLRKGKDGFDVLRDAVCLADGEQAGILPTLVRDHFQDIAIRNGLEPVAAHVAVKRAARLHMSDLVAVGEGPSELKQLGIQPRVEGRIVCLNGDG